VSHETLGETRYLKSWKIENRKGRRENPRGKGGNKEKGSKKEESKLATASFNCFVIFVMMDFRHFASSAYPYSKGKVYREGSLQKS
jgi:hypothetical protein